MRYVFCPKCGAKLSEKPAGDEGNVPYCEACKKYWFDTFADASIIMVVNELDEIALLRQGYLSDRFASFVAGYIKPGESAEETAEREVFEEIGVKLDSLEYYRTVWFEKNELLMHAYIGHAKKCELKLSEEVDSAAWTPCEKVADLLFPDTPGNAAFALYKHFMSRRRK